MEDKLSSMLMDGVEEMYHIMMNTGKKGFNAEEAKMKILANNSMTTAAKTLIQSEILKITAKNGENATKNTEKKFLGLK